MKLLMYSIYDDKALCYGTPFFQVTDGIARRMLRDLVSDPSSQLNRYSNDFHLYALAEVDTVSGYTRPYDTPVFVEHASTYEHRPSDTQEDSHE